MKPKVSGVTSCFKSTQWCASLHHNNSQTPPDEIILSTSMSLISPAFSLFLAGQMHICRLRGMINAVQKLHLSRPLNQHTFNCTVTSTAQWAKCFLECGGYNLLLNRFIEELGHSNVLLWMKLLHYPTIMSFLISREWLSTCKVDIYS